jgi:hypothetical protein
MCDVPRRTDRETERGDRDREEEKERKRKRDVPVLLS